MNTLALQEVSDLDSFLKDNKYKNLHGRKTYIRQGKSKLKYLFVIHALKGQTAQGYLCGDFLEFRFNIDLKGKLEILSPIIQGTKEDAIGELESVRKEIMKRVYADPLPSGVFPKRTPGSIYLRRWTKHKISKKVNDAILQGTLSKQFVDTIVDWNIQVLLT